MNGRFFALCALTFTTYTNDSPAEILDSAASEALEKQLQGIFGNWPTSLTPLMEPVESNPETPGAED